jgi:hypothetical protein
MSVREKNEKETKGLDQVKDANNIVLDKRFIIKKGIKIKLIKGKWWTPFLYNKKQHQITPVHENFNGLLSHVGFKYLKSSCSTIFCY